MKNSPRLACLVALSLCAPALGVLLRGEPAVAQSAQQPTQAKPSPAAPQTPAPPSDEDEVVRININLVQVDVVVTARDGRQVTNLRPEDFEIYEDSRPQQITHFSYVSTETPAAPNVGGSELAAAAPADQLASPAASKPLRPADVRRTIALVVDDLNMSYESVAPLRASLRKYIEEQVRPGDLVAVIRTASDAGGLQQFTSDKRQMLAAVERVRYSQCSSLGIQTIPRVQSPPTGIIPAPSRTLCADYAGHNTHTALKFTVESMRELPGRKSLIIFSDNLPIEEQETDNGLAPGFAPAGGVGETGRLNSYGDRFQQTAEAAIRASVVIYGVDTRGLPTLMVNAIDKTGGMSGSQINALLAARSKYMLAGREGQTWLATETGGFVIRNTNDIGPGLRRVMEEQRGYYMIGYRPDEQTFNRRFHHIGVRVKNRSDLTVHTRKGFYGMTEEETRPAPRSREDRLRLALMSPFGADEVGVSLTAHFDDSASSGSYIRTLLHIDANSLTFADAPDGWHKAVIDVGGMIFGDNGQVVVEQRRTHTLSLRGQTYEHALRDGLDFALDLPLQKPGAYQVRVAVRDAATSRLGAAGRFVEVPPRGSILKQ
jgi:VWFA-related protein